ncbi:hypothetical protein [Streptomyces sp. NBC_00827]|uniref:hypothetical protein n=1 Tax=Streptomyces sp. NBC_00827 TaxID=2903677 RepID=UPI003864E77D|nr:hypothetical protein OG569_42540 [Streptomyces sp. NBC_00827]
MDVANEVLDAYSRDWRIDATPVSMHAPTPGLGLQPAVAAAQTIRRDLPRFLQALQPQTWTQTWAAMVHGGFTVTERLLSLETADRPAADWTCASQEETAHDTSPATLDRGRQRTEAALKAIRELARWLGIPDAHAARLLGHRRNYYNWVKGDFHPNPASLAGIHEAHAMVESLIKAEGEAKTRAWLKAYTGGKSRQHYLADSVGRAELARLARDMLYPPAPVTRWEPDEDLEYDAPPPPATHPTTSLRLGTSLPPKSV